MADFLWGLGLRSHHFIQWRAEAKVPALELMSDNLLFHDGGPALWHSSAIVERAEMILMHGIGLNIGGSDPISRNYLHGLRKLYDTFKPAVVSDHLCFTQSHGLQSYELLPVLRTQASLDYIASRIDSVQQFLGCQISLENVSAYVEYISDALPEGEFLSRLSEKTGCGILLDINNIFVSAKNFNLNPEQELMRYNFDSVTQIHIAGHSQQDDFLFDTHDTSVSSEVWDLLHKSMKSLTSLPGRKIPIILENDNSNCELKKLLSEVEQGKALIDARFKECEQTSEASKK